MHDKLTKLHEEVKISREAYDRAAFSESSWWKEQQEYQRCVEDLTHKIDEAIDACFTPPEDAEYLYFYSWLMNNRKL